MTNADADPAEGSIVSLAALENEKFVVGKVLQGGMGTVYQLVPVRLARIPPLALKTYQGSADRHQFIREAELWISLGTHAHVAHAIAYIEWRSRPAVIADWYDKSLAEVDIRKWPSSKIVSFALQLIDGLSYALDSNQIIHQDIKPANVLLDGSDAPRITDFGLARFAAETLSGVRSMEDLRPAMRGSVSLGPIGGTPLYMAPELLFLGASPSVRTDIFSVGVTLYESLTHQHPFLGPETGYHFRPFLRDAPLRRLLDQMGSGIQPLLLLIVAALKLIPESRPGSYSALLSEVGLRNSTASLRTAEKVGDVVAQATFLRAQGRYAECVALLRAWLQERPTNPVLLNSYAILLMAEGRQPEACDTWRLAVESLRFTSGKYEHALYIDPLANLAAQMVSASNFSEANELLSAAWSWSKGHSPVALISYPEFGWWYLYNGKAEEAYNHILAGYRSRSPDEPSLLWVTLAAWLSGHFSDGASKLAELYVNLPNPSLPAALCACVVASSLPKAPATELVEVAYRRHGAGLSEVAKDLGLNPPTFRPPLELEVCKTVIRSLDMSVTGGTHYGAIG